MSVVNASWHKEMAATVTHKVECQVVVFGLIRLFRISLEWNAYSRKSLEGILFCTLRSYERY